VCGEREWDKYLAHAARPLLLHSAQKRKTRKKYAKIFKNAKTHCANYNLVSPIIQQTHLCTNIYNNMPCTVLMVAEKPSIAQSIASILSKGKVKTTSPRLIIVAYYLLGINHQYFNIEKILFSYICSISLPL
jgi:hypothetical protein